MRRMWRTVPALFIALPALCQAPPIVQIDQLGFLAGCWRVVGDTSSYEEQWMRPSGGTMLGMSRTVRNGVTVAYEFLSIEVQNGKLAYLARPSGQAPASFELVRHSPTEAVFENLAHDFPQRIIYRLSGDRLDARVESADGRKFNDFPMIAASCP
jgi:hypothetical protein